MRIPYSRYFPTPSFLMMSSCAIDISDSSIKYGQIVATTNGLRLKKYGQIKIKEGIVVSGKIEKEKELTLILNNLRIKENLKFVRISLPEEQMYLFTISIPKNTSNIRDAVSLQLEENIPLKAIDTTFDYNIISNSEKDMIIEVSAMSTSTVESYLKVLSESSLVPLSFELEAQAIARSIIESEESDPVMIVDFGNTRTGVSVAYKGRIFMTTTLDMGGANLTNMISKHFGISFEEAEKMKRAYGLNSSTGNIGDIFPVILNGVSVLKDEINKQSNYWNKHLDSHFENKEIRRIILCGGDSNISGLASYLETSTGMRVENANVWVNISDMKISTPSISFEDSLGYATVLGLTLKDFSYDKFMLNILPQDFKKNNRVEYWKRFITMLFNIITVALVFAILLLFPSYFFSKQKEILAEDNLESFNLANPDLNKDSVDKIISDINQKLDKLSKYKNSNISNLVLKEILNSRPSGVYYNQILYNKRSDSVSLFEIRGVSRDRNTLRLLKTNLENNPYFESVDLPVSNFIESEDINFNISLILK